MSEVDKQRALKEKIFMIQSKVALFCSFGFIKKKSGASLKNVLMLGLR